MNNVNEATIKSQHSSNLLGGGYIFVCHVATHYLMYMSEFGFEHTPMATDKQRILEIEEGYVFFTNSAIIQKIKALVG